MLNFTYEERKAALAVIIIYFLGLGVNFISKQVAPKASPLCFNENLGKINLNAADKKLLMSISGIGEKLSRRIIDFREASGGFSCVEDLMSVKGMSQTKFIKIKDYLFVQ